MKALTKKLFRDLWNLKFQTLTISIIVTGGLALLISSWSSYESLKITRENFYNGHLFADIFAEMKRAPAGITSELKSIPGISIIEGRILIDGLASIRYQDEPAVIRLVSIPDGQNSQLNKIFLRRGRFPVETSDRSEVVLHEAFAKAHGLNPGDFIQVLVEGKYQKMQIVGIGTSPEYIYAISSVSVLPDDRHFGVVWVPYRVLARLSMRQDSINSVSLILTSNANPNEVLNELDRKLKPYGSLGAYLRKDQLSHRFIQDEINQQKGTAIFTPAIFLSVAAFLINVIFSRLISLSRPQIATLKALGFSNSEVAFHFFSLVTLMILSGIIPGIAIGIYIGKVFARIYLDFYHFPQLQFILSQKAVWVGVIAGFLPGLLGAGQSIRRAFLLVPAVAMKPPMPPVFRQSLIDKILGVKMKPMGKIIFRNIFHRPDRMLMITIGMATSLGILITAMSWNGMVSALLELQFQRVQREDIELRFVHQVTQNGLQSLKNRKGVLSVEGYRSVPVRIRFRQMKKEIALTGWPSHPQMRKALDEDLKTIPLPDYGIQLGRYFHDVWKLKKGDVVEIEVLEGKQKKFTTVISSFSDEFFGQSATMKIEELSRLMDEEPGYNLALLKVDPNEINSLYVELKNIPEIGSVVLKNAMYKGFQKTMGNIISTATFILISFALAIGIGIIYNSIRVSFSERAWEMATLEVMGLDKLDVFVIIFMEISLQVLFALIPGCLFGYWMTVLTLSGIHTETFSLPVVIQLETYVKGIMIVLITLLFCSLIVYRMIDKLSLVDALKSRE